MNRIEKLQKTRRLSRPCLKFMQKLEEFSELLHSEGLIVHSEPSSYSLDLYCRFSVGAQRKFLVGFEKYFELIKEMRSKGLDLFDSRRLTWAFLKSMNWQPCSNTFANIDSKDIIEIYNRDYVQVFRNLQFFEHFNCSVFDLLILDWMTLFKRSSKIEEKIFFQMESAFRGLPRTQWFKGIEKHSIEDRLSKSSHKIWVELKTHSPLISRIKKTKRSEAMLITSKVQGRPGRIADHLERISA